MLTHLKRAALLALTAPVVGMLLAVAGCQSASTSSGAPAADSYLFCFWNVENLFDDRNDGRTGPGDKEYDGWFARDSAALELKLKRLSEALIKLNGGKGPDILALAEVESERAADLLRQALNRRLDDEALHYTHLLMKEPNGGRHIAPAILTRLPVVKDRTQMLGKRQRILEGHIKVDDRELVVLAAHWTSRLPQPGRPKDEEEAGARQRADYADQLYGRFRAMYRSNPKVSLMICGDFNDPPDARSVLEHLHASGDLDAVRNPTGNPLLFNLFSARAREEKTGTHNHRGKWFVFDQIVVSPGMVDGGAWTCDPASAQIVNTLFRPGDKQHRPWSFGNERYRGERGYSDHFPVTVRLRVQGE